MRRASLLLALFLADAPEVQPTRFEALGSDCTELHACGYALTCLAEGSFGPPTGYFHLCLCSDDLRGDVEALRAGGVPILIEPQVGKDHNLQAWIRDADGHLIELMQLSEDSPQRRIARGER